MTPSLLHSLLLVSLNLLMPGAGLVSQGRFRWALFTQMALVLVVIIVCWTRLLFHPGAILLSALMVFSIYLASTLLCLQQARASNTHQPNHMVYALGFTIVCAFGWSSGFALKAAWLGFEVYHVPGNSMSPTLRDGDVIIADTWIYNSRAPRAGEIIVFTRSDRAYIKRIYAIEGEFIEQSGALVSKRRQPSSNTTLEIDRDQVFVVGDNRPESRDSRHFGTVAISDIAALASLKILALENGQIDLKDFGRKLHDSQASGSGYQEGN